MPPSRNLPGRARQPESTTRISARDGCEVSIVIPSYNSRATIRACLTSVLAQETTLTHEVLLADSSDDGTDELVRESFPTVRVLHSPERLSCGAARNAGIQHARGKYVLLVDTDCVVGPDWVERTVAGLREHHADGVCGSLVNGTPRSLSGTVGYFLEFFRFLGPRGKSDETRFLLGGNSAYRRSIFGRFRFPDSSAGDDFTFSSRLSRRGAKLVFIPKIAVTHSNRTGVRRVLRYQYELGRAAARYRRESSPGIVRALTFFPPAVLLMPPVTLLRIAVRVAARCRVSDVARFLIASPAMLVANYVWAFGLLAEITSRRAPSQDPALGERVGG